jgi:tyrosyl-tRNA synthetase
MSVVDVLKERGFIENTTHENELYDYIAAGNTTCYIGFDPTASSFHVGSLIPIMALAHMQKNGHRPIALVGGGTGLVGDPSGKTEMRQLLSIEKVEENAVGLKEQLSRFIQFGDGDHDAFLLNNADWLVGLEYIPFLRDIGRHFSVNRMIKAESYKARIDSEEGLNFIEFNYMLLQAYDFLKLYDDYKCKIQMGGSDQWGNIVAGIDLIRRMRQETAFGITFPLVTTSSGAKMGKSASGAVWLDPERTSPYEYYQYWVNTDDKDVARFLALFTFLPMDEIQEASKLEGAHLNSAKTVLAFETTKLCHGTHEAQRAYHGAIANFGLRVISKNILPSSSVHQRADISFAESDKNTSEMSAEVVAVPHSFIDHSELKSGIPAFKLYQKVGLAKSGSDARRLIQQGGAYINGNRVESGEDLITLKHIVDGEIALKAGKKKFHKIKIKM